MLAYKYTRKNIDQKLMNTIPMAIKCQETGIVDKCLWKGSSLFVFLKPVQDTVSSQKNMVFTEDSKKVLLFCVLFIKWESKISE